MTSASERALEAAVTIFTRLDGSARHDDGDLVRVAGGRPFAAFNHVVGIRLSPATVAGRVDEVGAAMHASGSLPATWWVTPSSQPGDLGARLSALGLEQEEPEFGMVIELDGEPIPPPALPPSVTLEELPVGADLGGWTTVMAAAYGWGDPAKAATMAELYRVAPGEEPPWVHVVASRAGVPAACASLFTLGGHAFVTNVGTIPRDRGLGLGSAVTSATLRIAQRLGYGRAILTASVMGRTMYRRLGFRDEVRLDRYVQGPPHS